MSRSGRLAQGDPVHEHEVVGERLTALDELHGELSACRRCAEAGYFIGSTPILVRLSKALQILARLREELLSGQHGIGGLASSP